VQPKPVAAGFVATDYGRVHRQLQPSLRAGNFLEHPINGTGRHLADPRTLAETGS
jgi:hypothetical protein